MGLKIENSYNDAKESIVKKRSLCGQDVAKDTLQYHTDVKIEDKSTQTDNFDIQTVLQDLIQRRVKRYEIETTNENFINSKHSPLLKQLINENKELLSEAHSLQEKLNAYERRTRKSHKGILNQKIDESQTVPPKSHPVKEGTFIPPSLPVHNLPLRFSPYQQPSMYRYYQQQPLFVNQQPSRMTHQPFQIPFHSSNPHRSSRDQLYMQRAMYQAARTNQLLVDKSFTNQRVAKVRTPPLAVKGRKHSSMHDLDPDPFSLRDLESKEQAMLSILTDTNATTRNNRECPLITNKNNAAPTKMTRVSKLPMIKATISPAKSGGVVLTWGLLNKRSDQFQCSIAAYHLYAVQGSDVVNKPPADIQHWKRVGIVDALPLPMACTLTQFARGKLYLVAVLPIYKDGRDGELSNPCSITLD